MKKIYPTVHFCCVTLYMQVWDSRYDLGFSLYGKFCSLNSSEIYSNYSRCVSVSFCLLETSATQRAHVSTTVCLPLFYFTNCVAIHFFIIQYPFLNNSEQRPNKRPNQQPHQRPNSIQMHDKILTLKL